MSDEVTIKAEKLRVLVDVIAGSMDFGSGFLDIEDVEALWYAAEILGISQMDVTPSEFKHLIPHSFESYPEGSRMVKFWSDRCMKCGKDEGIVAHASIV
jgi:hypothetical protein